MKYQRFADLTINKLDKRFSSEISALLRKESPDYSKYFVPFTFDSDTIYRILDNLKKDSFWGIFVVDKLVGFYMLRGFDEGYDIPSYGVWISKEYSNKGLSKFTLQHASSYCKINQIKKIMLKVHPGNTAAKTTYENFGFHQEGFDSKNNNLIYYKEIL